MHHQASRNPRRGSQGVLLRLNPNPPHGSTQPMIMSDLSIWTLKLDTELPPNRLYCLIYSIHSVPDAFISEILVRH